MPATNQQHSFNNSRTASVSEPCPLCNGEDWCYLIDDFWTDEVFKVVCGRTQPEQAPPGWKYTKTSRDNRQVFIQEGYRQTRRSKKSKYPQTVELNPQILDDIPQWQDVNIPTRLLTRGHIVKLKPGFPNHLYVFQNWKKAPIGEGVKAVLTLKSGYGSKEDFRESDIEAIVTWDENGKEQFIEYFYSENQKMVRTQWTDRRKVYNDQSKKVRPWYKASNGNWIEKKGDAKWQLYRYEEAKNAILSGDFVFVVGGEQAVEVFRSLGLIATCNQGGEKSYKQIAEDLAEHFKLARSFNEVDQTTDEGSPQCKPVLVIWGDNDKTGQDFAHNLFYDCQKKGITAVVIDPLKLWADMPEKGDIKDWIDWCKSQQMSEEGIYYLLESVIDDAIDQTEEEDKQRQKRDRWQAPVSQNGEIGVFKQDKQGNRYWEPACNFDFQVERELKDANGGALVIQVKRSFEQQQHRIVLNSCDYTAVDTFTNALKKGLGTGIVCNLTKAQLGALIHVRLQEYRTNRKGKIYKRIDRYGQQEVDDGTWVFNDIQFTKNGEITSEEETLWVFDGGLGKEDFIPCPKLAPQNGLLGLQQLIASAREVFGQENIIQFLLCLGWTVAGLHFQEIKNKEKRFPILNAYGEAGSGKTIALEAVLSVIGQNWADEGILCRSSISAIYERLSKTGSLPQIWDDPPRGKDTSEQDEFCKAMFNAKDRVVRGNTQTPHSPIGFTTNHLIGASQEATFTRIARIPFYKGGNTTAIPELKAAQKIASGSFLELIKIGYSPLEIKQIERQFIPYLSMAHVRIAWNLALVTWYAEKVIELVGGKENIRQWVIDNLLETENDAENSGDSLADFTRRIIALEGKDYIGSWNKRLYKDETGKEWIAIHSQSIWGEVERHSKPATYDIKSLKTQLKKRGYVTDKSVRFDSSRDEVLAYKRALISPRIVDGEEIKPNKPSTANKKAWLLPLELFEAEMGKEEPVTENLDEVTDCNQDLVTASKVDNSMVSSNPIDAVTDVTEKKEIRINKKREDRKEKPEHEYCPTQNKEIDFSVTTGDTVTKATETLPHQAVEPVTEISEKVVTGSVTKTSNSTFPIGEKVIVTNRPELGEGEVTGYDSSERTYAVCFENTAESFDVSALVPVNTEKKVSSGKKQRLERQRLQEGDKVEYIGNRFPQLQGIKLTIDSISKADDQAVCRKPDGYFTTSIALSDLRKVQ